VDHNRKPAQRRPALDVGDEVVGNLDAFVGRPQHEVAGVEDVLAALLDFGQFDVLVDLVLAGGVDTRDVGVLELQELPAKPQVDAGGLNLDVGVVERFDDEVARFEATQDIRIGEYHYQSYRGGTTKSILSQVSAVDTTATSAAMRTAAGRPRAWTTRSPLAQMYACHTAPPSRTPREMSP